MTIASGLLWIAGEAAVKTGAAEKKLLFLQAKDSDIDLETTFRPALDVMLGTDPNADPGRKNPVPGDLRLLVTQVNKQTQAAVFRAVVPGTKEPVKYESPVGSATIDQVENITGQVKFIGGKRADKTGKMRNGVPVLLKYSDYEISVPLSSLGLSAKEGLTLQADIGLLLGQPGATADRVYWHNKSASMTTDLPTEGRLTPHLWGKWKFTLQLQPDH